MRNNILKLQLMVDQIQFEAWKRELYLRKNLIDFG